MRIYPPGLSDGLIALSPTESLSIGRDAQCRLEIGDEYVSRLHAIVRCTDGEYFLEDASSSNGSFVNGRRVTRQALRPGDQIRIGTQVFKFLSSDHIEVQYHEAVYEMMTVDGLTRVHNRRYFDDAFRRELLRSTRHWRPLALLLFDVDRFKHINDTYGHLVGDEVLKGLCSRVRQRVRADELLARVGGEEFAISLAEISLENALRVAEQIRAMVADQPFTTTVSEVPVTISVGVGYFNGQEPVTPTGLFDLADQQLFEAKRRGRNQVCHDAQLTRESAVIA